MLTKGYKGYNVFNIYIDNNIDNEVVKDIYILFINENHFNYLEVVYQDNENKTEIDNII